MEFTIIGDDDEQAPTEFPAEAAATTVALEQTLYEEIDEPWNRGGAIGAAHGVGVVTPRGRIAWAITFSLGASLGQEDTIAASGVLPAQKSSMGPGVLAVTGGTGRFARVTGQVTVEVRNPKRYRFDV